MKNKTTLEKAQAKYPTLSPRAALVADFIETYCTLSKGGGVSQPLKLMPWQFEALNGIYPGKPGDKRIITRALISIARKNGKTEFCSALALVHLCGPEAGMGQEIVCAAAASQDQASLVFNGAKIMIENNPILRRNTTFRTNRIIWKKDKVNNYIKTISTKFSSAQGLIPALWFFDEIAETESRELYESLNYAQTDQTAGGLGIIISTRSNRPNSLFTVLHDEAVIGQQNGINQHWFVRVWSADPKSDDLFNMDQVEAANPALGYILDRDTIEADLKNAIANPSARPEFRARRLNIESGTQASLIDPQIWADAGAKKPIALDDTLEKYKGEDLVLAIDLGSTTSMTSLALYWPKHKFVITRNWMARSQVKHNEIIHKAPYSDWAEMGYMELIAHEHHGGMTYDPIADFISRCFHMFNVVSFRYDGWNMTRLFDALKHHDLHLEEYPLKGVLDKFVQGMVSYGEAIIEFEDLMLNKLLKHDQNPVTNMSVNVCQVEVKNRTTESLRVPVKNNQQLPNDAAVAILMAVCQRSLVKSHEDTFDDEFLDGFSRAPTIKNDSDPSGLMDLV